MKIKALTDFVLGGGEVAEKDKTYDVDVGLALSLIRRGRAEAITKGEDKAEDKKKG